MPIIKVYGVIPVDFIFNLDKPLKGAFGGDGVGIVHINSQCRTPGGEMYTYVEVLYREEADAEQLVEIIRSIDSDIDIVKVQLFEGDFIPAKE